ncbi:MAG TPA: M28 family metallopeptidase [Bacteroidota bacterium]|jgi:hypothetical protein|nr:M28 family metallopeptidase [Bacteroidota bacterium]
MKSFASPFVTLFVTLFLFSGANSQTEFSQENATQILKTLSVDIGPRPMGSPAERRALQFAIEKFKEYGCDTAYVMEMPYSSRANTTSGIAVGIKHGARKSAILVGGHIDSAGPEIPGADDDGSGASTVMEAARVLCKKPMLSTLVFCCWGGEEQGLEGSKYFVDHYAGLDSVFLMLQIDMANGIEKIDLDPDTHGASAPKWLVKAAIEEFYGLGYEHLGYATHFYSVNYASSSGAGSDQESFLEKGIPAIDFTTDATKPIHTPRDNFENMDPRGMKRSGDVVVKLVNRFDDGIPGRNTEQYWLYLVGKQPIFVPFPVIWGFAGLTMIMAAAAFVLLRKRRLRPDDQDKVQWSGVKGLLFSAIIAAFAWLSSEVVSVMKNVRHPWMTAIPSYYLLAGIAACIGIWISARLSVKLRITRDPSTLFARAAVMLLGFLILLGIANVKLMIEPAVALLLISLAMIVRNPYVKFLLLFLSPWWMLEVIFSEWSPLFFRGASMALPADFATWMLFNGIMLIAFTIYFLPFVFAGAAVGRDSSGLSTVGARMRSVPALLTVIAAFALFAGYLTAQPVYDRYWYRDLRIDERYDMTSNKKNVTLKSGEYLYDLHISAGGKDTVIDSRGTEAAIPVTGSFDTTWLSVDRQAQRTSLNDTTTVFDITLTLSANMRPYQVTVTYDAGRDKLHVFETSWDSRYDNGLRSISWYSFPDSVLRIPVKFQASHKDSVRESIEVTFDSLAQPMNVSRELTYVIPRTRYTASHTYK